MSQKYTGGFITKSPVAPTTSAASGIWTLDQQQQAKQAGNWPSPPVFIEDLFSTYLYDGNSSTQTIVNGVDLLNKGGLVWAKNRTGANSHLLVDTVRGFNSEIFSNLTSAASTGGSDYTSWNTNGYSLGFISGNENVSGRSFVSWTFAKQPKFFDIVTYTGNGTGERAIAHNLGSVPGCVIVKKTSATGSWGVWHRGNGVSAVTYFELETTAAGNTSVGNTAFTSATTFTVDGLGPQYGSLNDNGAAYVAYLFAHDAGGFPVSGGGSTNGISCGSYTGSSNTPQQITLGYEPQWVLLKKSSTTDDWYLFDNMRGMALSTGNNVYLKPNSSAAETASSNWILPNATGFVAGSSATDSATYIYIAIRRGPMKTPTVGTSVFSPVTYTGTGATQSVTASFPVDLSIIGARSQAAGSSFYDRLRGATKLLIPWATSAESTKSDALTSFASNTAITLGADTSTGSVNNSGSTYVDWNFRRAPGFFDEVCFTGTGSTLVLNHNLTVAPELIIGKRRTGGSYWILSGNFGASTYWYKNDWGANDSSTSSSYSGGLSFGAQPTSTTVTLDNNSALNVSAYDAVLWMWATVAGVSKVGTYTGTGALQTIPCGFTTGARFVLVTRVGVVGNNATYIYDSARGITSSNDPYLLLNTSDAEVTGTNYVDTDTTGFKVTAAAPAGLNASGGNYIFLAIA